MKKILKQEHRGAVAFEYIIILVMMAAVIFIAWKYLGDAVVEKAQEIAKFISNTGKDALGGTVPGGTEG